MILNLASICYLKLQYDYELDHTGIYFRLLSLITVTHQCQDRGWAMPSQQVEEELGVSAGLITLACDGQPGSRSTEGRSRGAGWLQQGRLHTLMFMSGHLEALQCFQ